MPPRAPATVLKRLVLVCLCLLLGGPPASGAGDASIRNFDLAPGDAAETLKLFAEQARREIMFPTERVAGVKTNAVKGAYTSRDALERMVRATGLLIVEDDTTGALMVYRPAAPAPTPPPSSTPETNAAPDTHRNPMKRKNSLPIFIGALLALPLSSTSAQKEGNSITLDPFTVTNTATKGYMATNAISGTAMNTPLRDVPMAINVITSEFLEDSLVGNVMADAFHYNSSVTQTFRPGFGGVYNMFSIRGFQTRNILIDGVQGGNEVPTYLIDRIEIVKGPNTLYSISDPGGLINIVTKRPTGKNSASFTQKIGQFTSGGNALVESLLDADFATANKRLKLRLIGAHTQIGNWRPVGGKERTSFIGFSADYELAPNTHLVFQQSGKRDGGAPIEGGIAPFERVRLDLNGDGDTTDTVRGITESSVPQNNSYLPHSFNGLTSKDWFLEQDAYTQAGLQHKFSDAIFVQYVFNHTYLNREGTARVVNTFDTAGNAPVQYGGNDYQLNRIDAHTLNAHFDFATGPARHRVLAGARVSEFRNSNASFTLNPAVAANRVALDALNAAGRNIRYVITKDEVLAGRRTWEDGAPTQAEVLALGTRNNNINYSTLDLTSYYLTDSLSFKDGQVKVLGGLRYIKVKDKAVDLQGVTASNPINSSDTSVQLGVVYDITRRLNAYANYATAYNPNTYHIPTATFFPPETSTSYEVGLKFDDLWDSRLGGSLSLFTIEKENVVRTGADQLTFVSFTELSKDESKGVELELFFNITKTWNTVINYSYLDAKVVESRTLPAQLPLEGAPPHRFSVWTSYAFREGPLAKLRFGGGVVRAEGPIQQFGTSNNALVLENGYTQVDLFARYGAKIAGRSVTFGANVANANDVFYLRARGMTNTPRRVMLSVDIDL